MTVLNDAEYSKQLTAAGVENEVFVSKGATHGYFTAPGTSIQYDAYDFSKAYVWIFQDVL